MDKQKKEARYKRIYDQLNELIGPTTDIYARMATISAVLHHKIEYYFWTGFYLLIDGELTVGPYQGPVACQVLKKDVGVCWAGINQQKSIVVPNVHEFPGHIACDSRSNSEIVIPLIKNDQVIGILDVDSKSLNSFDEIDQIYLEKIVKLIEK